MIHRLSSLIASSLTTRLQIQNSTQRGEIVKRIWHRSGGRDAPAKSICLRRHPYGVGVGVTVGAYYVPPCTLTAWLLTIQHPVTVTARTQAIDRGDAILYHAAWCCKCCGLRTMVHLTTGNIVIRGIAHATDIGHHTMPDGGRTSNTDHILHRFIIGVSRPDADHRFAGIPYRPVIFEITRCTGLGGHIGISCIGRIRISYRSPKGEVVIRPELDSYAPLHLIGQMSSGRRFAD